MNKVKFVLFSAGISLALAFTFGCSGGDDGGTTEQSYNYCIIAGNTCLTGPFTASTCTGQLSNSCPRSSNSISSSSVNNGSSSSMKGSSSSVAKSSSSSAKSNSSGVPFNENSQIYLSYEDYSDSTFHIGNAYTGSGIVLDNYNSTIIGSVTNGIVHLELPATIPIPDEDLWNCSDRWSYCTVYPNDIKYYKIKTIRLTDNSMNEIGDLDIRNIRNGQRYQYIEYMYFSKAGKITCNNNYGFGVKAGWNKMYYNAETGEESTNNILTKEAVWTLYIFDEYGL